MAKRGIILYLLVVSFTLIFAVPVSQVVEGCECKSHETLNLTELRCKGKQLKTLPDFGNFDDCDFDKVVISSNDITEIANDSFIEVPDLTIVHLFTNNINSIGESAFKSLSKLREVDLSDNSIVAFDPWIFSENTELEIVDLSDNPLVEIDESSPILSSKSITTLILDDCKLKTITREMLSELPNLKKLDISSNNIQSLDLAVFDLVPNLNRLELHNNRWKCDCDLYYLVLFADLIREDKREPLMPIKCFTPNHEMLTWSEEDSSDKYCHKGNVDKEVIVTDEVIVADEVILAGLEVVVENDDAESSTEIILLAENSFIDAVASYLDSIYSFIIIFALLILTLSLTVWLVQRVRRQAREQQVPPTASRTANKDNKFYMMNVHSRASAFASTDQLLPNAEPRDLSNMIVPVYSQDLPIVFQYPARSNVHIYEPIRGEVPDAN